MSAPNYKLHLDQLPCRLREPHSTAQDGATTQQLVVPSAVGSILLSATLSFLGLGPDFIIIIFLACRTTRFQE